MSRSRTPDERATERALFLRWADVPDLAAQVRDGQAPAIDRAIAYLLEDPRYHGSGYEKERLWRRLAHPALSGKQLVRLEQAALGHLQRRMTREFRAMARTMARIGTPRFWEQVRVATAAPERSVQRRASILAAYAAGPNAGDAFRLGAGLR
jgi:hypothetical protein